MRTPKKHDGRLLLSKSRYLAGLQCPRLLWVTCNAGDRLPAADPGVELRFEQGHQVGELARTLFPTGVEIDWDVELGEVLRRSREALAARRPLFEPGFLFEGAYTRADVLVPVGRRRWDIVEVKSAGSVKPEHLEDLAFQWFVYAGAGLPIRRCHLMHVDTGYVRRGEVDARALLVQEDVTAGVRALLPKVGRRVRRMLATIGRPGCPRATVGARCSSPYPCPLEDECWAFLPRRSVFTLVSGGQKSWALLQRGILAVRDIPAGFPLTRRQRVQVAAVRRRRAHVDRPALRRFLGQLEYPLRFLDFETVGTPIPLYEGARPWAQVPFQCSVHVVERPGVRARHFGFLPRGREDPRPGLLELLRERLGDRGSVVAYNASFERLRLQELAACFPEHSGWIEALLPRFVDLLRPFRALWYYHPRQEGSASLKRVMPALTGRGYDDLDVADGATAGQLFLERVLGAASACQRQRARRALERYCGRDTEGLIWIVDRLRALAG